MKLEPLLAFTRELAAASAEVILAHYGTSDLNLEMKEDESPVTVADRRAEEVMRDMIQKRHPEHGIIGEEYGVDRSDAEWVWVLDPIDGTKSFISNVPLFGTLIGLLHEGRPVLGCIHQPVLRQLMLGDGQTTTLNGEPVRVRPGRSLADATLLITDQRMAAQYQDGSNFDEVVRSARLVRTWGDCYGYLLVAAGWADAMLDPILNPWDLLPVIPIIEGAGGRITDWQGRPAGAHEPNSAVAASADFHPDLIQRLNVGRA